MSTSVPKLPENVVAHQNQEGLIELIDVNTGNVVAVQHSIREILKGKQADIHEITTPDGRKVWVEKGLASRSLKHRHYELDTVAMDLFCQNLTKGWSMKRSAEELGLDINIIRQWRVRSPKFNDQIKLAKLARADEMHEKVLEEAEDSFDTKVRIDAYKYMAEKGNPEAYGQKTKIVGDPNAPLGFIIETGIRRPGDSGFKEGTDATQNHLEPGGNSKKVSDNIEDAVLVMESTGQQSGVPTHDDSGKNVENIAPSVDAPVRVD